MEPSVDIFVPARPYARVGWVALACSVLFVMLGFRWPVAFVPAFLFTTAAAFMFWLAACPVIRVGETQFNIGERCIAWREVKEINNVRVPSPLVLRLKLTNSRQKILVFPGERARIAQLLHLLRKHSYLATFDGVAYRDYWTWSSMAGINGKSAALEHPVRMISTDDEDEIEKLYQKLKAVGRLDGRAGGTRSDAPKASSED